MTVEFYRTELNAMQIIINQLTKTLIFGVLRNRIRTGYRVIVPFSFVGGRLHSLDM